jgi:hypothetical protein
MNFAFQQELLRQSRESFNLAQRYYQVVLVSCAASRAIGFIVAILMLFGRTDIATFTAITQILPMLTCHQIMKTGAKQLEDASDRLHDR